MTIVALAGPPIPLFDQSVIAQTLATSSSTFVLDAASEKAAHGFQAPKAGTINKIGFYVGAYTSTGLMECELQTDSAGTPSGTKVGSSTTGTVSATGTGWFEATLATGAVVTRGTVYWAVVAQPASSPGNCSLQHLSGFWGGTTNARAFPYGALYTASWAKQTLQPQIFVGYDDGTWAYIPQTVPCTATSTLALHTGTTPDEAALRFQSPVPCTIAGVRLKLNEGASSRDFDIVLYDAANSALATKSWDADDSALNNSSTLYTILFDTPVDISKDTTYRLAHKPTTAGQNTIEYFDVPTAALMDAVAGGRQCYWSERTDAGSWTDTTTRRPVMVPLVSGFDDGTGGAGGGLIINPGLSGGLLT